MSGCFRFIVSRPQCSAARAARTGGLDYGDLIMAILHFSFFILHFSFFGGSGNEK
jgi:hypothetical protein